MRLLLSGLTKKNGELIGKLPKGSSLSLSPSISQNFSCRRSNINPNPNLTQEFRVQNGRQGHPRPSKELVPFVPREEASSSEGISEEAWWRLPRGLRAHRRQLTPSHAHRRRISLQAPPSEPREQRKGSNFSLLIYKVRPPKILIDLLLKLLMIYKFPADHMAVASFYFLGSNW